MIAAALRRWIVVVLMVSSVSVLIPATVRAGQAPATQEPKPVSPQDRPAAQEGPAYDPSAEATFTGTVTRIRSGDPGRLGWLMRVHTLGLGHKGTQETQLFVNTDEGTVEIDLGPTAFVKEQRVEINEGDGVEVIGSRVTIAESSPVLARQVRKGDSVWTLRDPSGQPLWNPVETQPRRFWTKNRIIVFSVVAAKVVLLATVLRH
jgi:hypothetical protein